jgi:hypothetical protein
LIAAPLIVLGSAACDRERGREGLSASAPGIAGDKTGRVTEASEQGGSAQSVAGEFYEVLLKWSPAGADPRVREWLERQGLTAMPMKAGMLTLASPGQIEKSFGVSLETAQPPLALPVPRELGSSVASVTVLKPRSYH